jgi:hypothetical protein
LYQPRHTHLRSSDFENNFRSAFVLGMLSAATTRSIRERFPPPWHVARIERRLPRALASARVCQCRHGARPEPGLLAQLVAQRTGLPPQEAEARVAQVANEAARIAKDTTDRARKTAATAGFVTAASLLLSLAAAWWGAQRGGHHRDTSRPARFF